MIEKAFLIFEILAVLLCLYGLYGEKIKWNIYTISFVAIEITIYQLEAVIGQVVWLEIFIHILFFVYSKIQFHRSWKISILNYVLCIIISSVVQLICYLPVMVWYTALYDISYYFINILLIIIMCIINKSGILAKISSYMQRKGKIVPVVLGFSFLFVMYTMFRLITLKIISALEYLALVIICSLFFVLLFLLQREKELNRQMKAERNLNKLYGDALEELIDKIRVNQHNYRNQLVAIQGMTYTANSLDELKQQQQQYCDNILCEDKYSQIISGNNDPVIAGFLYSKISNVESNQIEINHYLCINKINNSLLAVDIITILGILIDNALEEVINDENKGIEVKLYEEDGLNIEVGNVCRFISNLEMTEFFKKGNSSKGENRGLGLYTLKNIVKKWHGEIYPVNREIKK